MNQVIEVYIAATKLEPVSTTIITTALLMLIAFFLIEGVTRVRDQIVLRREIRATRAELARMREDKKRRQAANPSEFEDDESLDCIAF